MNKIIIIFILIIIILLSYTIEGFESNILYNYFNPVNKNTPKSFYEMDDYYTLNFSQPTEVWNNETKVPSIYENRFNFVPLAIYKQPDNITTDRLSSSKCCLVQKFANDDDQFQYTYKKYENNDCNIDNFELDHNNQLLFDGYNGWSNDYCTDNNSNLGSCQHYDFECIDFVTKTTCDEYNKRMPLDKQNRKILYNWSPLPCYTKQKTPKNLTYIEPTNVTYINNREV
jgi:hypothetical protein